MKEVSFIEIDEISLKVETVRSLMTAMEYGIFESPESKELFRTGFVKIIEQVQDIEEELKEMVREMTGEYKKDKKKDVA